MLHSWPLATAPGHLARFDNDDASLNTWVIAWVAHIVPRAPLQLFEAPIFYPDSHTLAYSEHLFVPAMMGAPLLWAGASPVLVHNLLIIAGLALSGWAMFLVMARWTGSQWAALVAGLLYAFNAHVLTRFPHLQAQHVEFMPFVLLGLDGVLTRNRTRDAVLLAGAFVLQSLCSDYLLVFAAFAAVAAAAVRPGDWWPRHRGPERRSLVAAGLVSVVVLAPFLWPYFLVSREQGMSRPVSEVARYSAHWQDYLVTGGRLHYAAWSHRFYDGRTALFPGVVGAALTAAAVVSGVAWRDRRARMAVAVGALGLAFSFGPGLPGYAWLHEHITLLGGIRNAARWGWLVLLAVAVLAGFGVAEIVQRREWTGRKAAAFGLVLAVLVTVEALRAPVGFTPFEGFPRIYDRLAAEPHVVLAEFPLYSGATISRNGPYVRNNVRYFQPLINGYSGFQSPAFEQRAAVLRGFPGDEAIAELRRLGVTHVTVHAEAFAARSGREALDAVDHTPALQRVADDEGIRLYRVR